VIKFSNKLWYYGEYMNKIAISKNEYVRFIEDGRSGFNFSSLRRLSADRLLKLWRRKNAEKLKGMDAVKIIRDLRQRK